MPVLWPNYKNWFLYLSTLSIWSSLIFLRVCFSIISFHFTNILRASNLYLMGYIQQCLNKLSIKEKVSMTSTQCSLGRSTNTYVNTIMKTFRAVSRGVKFHLRLLVQNAVSTQFYIAGRRTFQ